MFTKRNALEVIESVFKANDFEFGNEVLEYVEKEFAALDHKNAKAKERAAQRRANGDALRGALKDMVGENPITVRELVNAINEDSETEVTTSMVVARMTQLVKAGEVAKVQVKDGSRKLVGYILA